MGHSWYFSLKERSRKVPRWALCWCAKVIRWRTGCFIDGGVRTRSRHHRSRPKTGPVTSCLGSGTVRSHSRRPPRPDFPRDDNLGSSIAGSRPSSCASGGLRKMRRRLAAYVPTSFPTGPFAGSLAGSFTPSSRPTPQTAAQLPKYPVSRGRYLGKPQPVSLNRGSVCLPASASCKALDVAVTTALGD